MNEIPPNLAADLAKEIYDLVNRDKTTEKVILELNKAYGSILTVSESHISHARTGGPGLIK